MVEKVYSGDRAKEIKGVLYANFVTDIHNYHEPLKGSRTVQDYAGNPVDIEDRAHVVYIPNGWFRQLRTGVEYDTEVVMDSVSSNGIVHLVGSKRAIKHLEKRAKIRW